MSDAITCHKNNLVDRRSERIFEKVKNRRSNGLSDNNLAHLHKMITNEKLEDNNDMNSSFAAKIKSPKRIFNNMKLIPLNEETAKIFINRSRAASSSYPIPEKKNKNKSSRQSLMSTDASSYIRNIKNLIKSRDLQSSGELNYKDSDYSKSSQRDDISSNELNSDIRSSNSRTKLFLNKFKIHDAKVSRKFTSALKSQESIPKFKVTLFNISKFCQALEN
jgi:hypothetical protein